MYLLNYHFCFFRYIPRSRIATTLGDSEGQGSLARCSPWGHKELADTTERLNNKELLGHMVALFLVSLEIYRLFSTVAAPMYIPTKSVQVFLFLHMLTNTLFVHFWMTAILTGVRSF